jgi:tetraacyldisaccharide 4'-kinase
MIRKTLTLLYAIGLPFSPLYSLIMTVRAFLYRSGVFKKTKLSVPVVSVGNLTMGGSGKTPMVLYISRLLQEEGLKPVIVSRGFGGKAVGPVNVVSDGKEILLAVDLAGDEPRMMAESLPGVSVLTGPRKAEVAKYAVEKFGAQSIVLDDGFQHMALERDVNLVLFNSHMPFGNGHVFPGGDLRESVKALGRAHAFIITGVDRRRAGKKNRELKSFLQKRFPGVPFYEGRYAHTGILHSQKAGIEDAQCISGMKLFGFCGIANPDAFKVSLEEMGAQLAGFKGFQDHYNYSRSDISRLVDQAKSVGADALIATEKDYVKVGSLFSADLPLLALQRKLIMDAGFNQFLLNKIAR